MRFTVSPEGTALDTTEATSDATGTARVVLRTNQEPGDNTVSVSVANLEAASITVVGRPPVALHVTPPTVTVDMLGTQQFRAIAEDASGRTIEVGPAWRVVGDKGSIDAQGNFAATALGDELVLATYAGLTGGAQITVVPGQAASVQVRPQEATVTAGTNYQFQAEVFNAHGYPLDVAPTWEVTNELGTIDSSGLLTATKSGQGSIVASAGGQTARAEITVVPGPLTLLQVEPAEVQMRAGESVQFRVRGFDAGGNEVAVEPSWSLKADLGELAPDGTFRALRAGSGRIQVAAGPVPIVRDIPVRVEAAELVRIEVEPHSLTLSAGVEHTFTATGYDAYDNPIEVAPTWFVTEPVGDIDAKGSFLARRTGSAQVQATASGITGQASVTVRPNDLARLVVQPAGPLTLTAGLTVSLTVTGYDAFGNTVAVTPAWSQTTQLGTLSAEGLFRAEKVGSGRLVARSGERSVAVAVTVIAGKLAKVGVTPTAATLQAGNLVAFHAKGFDAYDNEVPIEPTWRVTESIGEISSTGVLTALQARAGEVIATAQGIAGRAQVTVEPGALTLLHVTPEQLSLTAGETAEILVVGYDTYGNPVPVQPMWHVPEGMGSVAGNVLTAKKAGTGRIVVAADHLAAAIHLEVRRGELATIDITPATAEVASGQQQTFTVRGFDRGGNRVPVEATWEAKDEGGTITAEGVFTAQRAGKSRIQAKAGALQAETEVMVVPGAATTLQVTPETVSLVAGQSVSLQSEAFDAAGNRVHTAPTWTVIGAVGSVSNDGVFTAKGAGTGKIVATIGEVTRMVNVQVEPGSLATIAVAPWKLVMSAGEMQSFTATGYDAYGNVIAVQPKWSVHGGIGHIDAAAGTFKATTAGTGTVVAVMDTVAGLATVTVEPGAAAHLRIEPTDTILAAGESLSFAATASDAFNNVAKAEVTWDMETALGRMQQGVFVAERAGTTEIIARSGEAEARTTVQVQRGTVTRLQIIPREIAAVAGETIPLRALGFDAYENVAETPVTWELRGDIGSMTDAGAFTAGKQGKGQITARFNGLSASIPVSVLPGPVRHLVIRPTQAQVASTRSQDFRVVGLDAGGNERPVRVQWALTSDVGQLTQTGQFSGTRTGHGTIVAYTPMARATAEVTVQPGPVALLFVKPQPAAAPAGGRVTFQAQAFDAHQNPIPSFQPRWSVAGTIGTIDPESGVFTGTSVGEGKIQAKVEDTVGSADVVVHPGTPDADKSRLVASRLTVPADGKTPADIIVHVQDRYGNPIHNARVTLLSTRDDQIDQPISTNMNGIAFGHIRSLKPGRSELRAVIESVRISNPLYLTFQGPDTSG
jgi:Bacterial Ig-like domain (group 1)